MPTRVSPGNYPSHEQDRICPSCNRHPETPEHLIRCDCPARNKIRNTLHTKLSKLYDKHNIDPSLFQMWWLGMIMLNSPQDHLIEQYPPPMHPIFVNQQNIGWKQLYYGRISKQWTQFLNDTQPEVDATKFYSKVIELTWTYVLELWSNRNADQNQTTERFPPSMISDINGIYATRHRLPQPTQDKIFRMTKEELLTKPKQYIQSWINNSKSYIKAELKIIRQQQKANTQDIRQFFQPR